MQTIIQEAAAHGLLVALSAARLAPHDSPGNGQWHSSDVPEAAVLRSWTRITNLLCNQPNLFAVDLFEAPHGAAWGVGGLSVDSEAGARELYAIRRPDGRVCLGGARALVGSELPSCTRTLASALVGCRRAILRGACVGGACQCTGEWHGEACESGCAKGEVGEWKPWADVASCHFALHYACGSPERIDAFLDCVATNVKKGGVVVATIIDWLQLRQLLVNGGRIGDLCKVECSDEARTQLLQLPDESSAGHRAWGVEYKFTLGDAVQDCAEFVVHRPSLIARAAAKGLKCTLEARFDCF